jgi:MFS family permease
MWPVASRLLHTRGVVPALVTSSLVLSSLDIVLAYLPLLARERDFTPAWLTALLMTRGIATMGSRLTLGWMTSAFGRRRVLVVAGVVAAAALIAVVLPLPVVALMYGFLPRLTGIPTVLVDSRRRLSFSSGGGPSDACGCSAEATGWWLPVLAGPVAGAAGGWSRLTESSISCWEASSARRARARSKSTRALRGLSGLVGQASRLHFGQGQWASHGVGVDDERDRVSGGGKCGPGD